VSDPAFAGITPSFFRTTVTLRVVSLMRYARMLSGRRSGRSALSTSGFWHTVGFYKDSRHPVSPYSYGRLWWKGVH
jgi:hypothetical protein